VRTGETSTLLYEPIIRFKAQDLGFLPATDVATLHALIQSSRVCVQTMIYGSRSMWMSLDTPPNPKALEIGKTDLAWIGRLRRTITRRQNLSPAGRISSTPKAFSLPNSGLLF